MNRIVAIGWLVLGLSGCAAKAGTPAASPGTPAAGGQAVDAEAHWSQAGSSEHVVDDAQMLKRLEEAAADLPPNTGASRLALGDIGYPESAEEARKMGGMAIVLITALSQDDKELPLARVVLHAGDKEWELPRLGYRVTRLQNPDSPAGRAFGVNRYDGIYYLPVLATRHEGGLFIDFAANRTNFRSLEFVEGGSGALPDGVAEAPIGQPDPDTVATFVVREFPLVAQGKWTMAK